MVRYTSEQRVFLYDTYVKYGSSGKRRRKFQRKFHDGRVPSKQTIHTLVNKHRTTGLLIDRGKKRKRRVLTEKLDIIWARLEHIPRKPLKRLAQETGVSESSARSSTQLLKFRVYITTVIQDLQQRDPASRVHYCSWFLWSVVEGEIDPQLILSSDEAKFHLQGYINTQNNRYCSSENPHLTHEDPLHPVTVDVWCAMQTGLLDLCF
jgi:transposase